VLAKGDAFSRAGVKEIVEQAKKGLGGIDIVISNAGWTKFGAFNDLSECLGVDGVGWRKGGREA